MQIVNCTSYKLSVNYNQYDDVSKEPRVRSKDRHWFTSFLATFEIQIAIYEESPSAPAVSGSWQAPPPPPLHPSCITGCKFSLLIRKLRPGPRVPPSPTAIKSVPEYLHADDELSAMPCGNHVARARRIKVCQSRARRQLEKKQLARRVVRKWRDGGPENCRKPAANAVSNIGS